MKVGDIVVYDAVNDRASLKRVCGWQYYYVSKIIRGTAWLYQITEADGDAGWYLGLEVDDLKVVGTPERLLTLDEELRLFGTRRVPESARDLLRQWMVVRPAN